jgi:inorganic phosphate transporter, PiT family
MLLMVSTLIGSGTWLLVATLASLPVSTTHSIVGSLVGCGVLIGGTDLVNWLELVKISTTWLLSPALGLIATFTFWGLLGRFTVKSSNPIRNLKIAQPFMTGFTVCFVSLFLIYKGLQPLKLQVPIYVAVPVAVVLGLVSFAIAGGAPFFYKYVVVKYILKNTHSEIHEVNAHHENHEKEGAVYGLENVEHGGNGVFY